MMSQSGSRQGLLKSKTKYFVYVLFKETCIVGVMKHQSQLVMHGYNFFSN